MPFDALAELRAAGNPVDMLSAAEQAVLAELSPAEVATWNSIKARLDAAGVAAGGEVEGHGSNIML